MNYQLPMCTCVSQGPWTCARKKAIENLEHAAYEAGMQFIGHGLTRNVFAHPYRDYVVKLPRRCAFALANIIEYRVAQSGEFPVPEMHMEWVEGLPVIHAEKVRCASLAEEDEWAEKSGDPRLCRLFDGCQVGYTKDGRLVVYDLGHEEGIDAFDEHDLWRQ